MHKAAFFRRFLEGCADFVRLVLYITYIQKSKITWTSPPQRCLDNMQGSAKTFDRPRRIETLEVRAGFGLCGTIRRNEAYPTHIRFHQNPGWSSYYLLKYEIEPPG